MISERRLAPGSPLYIGKSGSGAIITAGVSSVAGVRLSFNPYLGRTISLTYSLPGSSSSVRVRSSPMRLYLSLSTSSGSITTSTTGSPSSIFLLERAFFLLAVLSSICFSAAMRSASISSRRFCSSPVVSNKFS